MPKFLHFRSNPELEALLTEEIEALREEGVPAPLANRSSVARTILTNYLSCRAENPLNDHRGAPLGDAQARRGITKAASREVISRVYGACEGAVQRAVKDAVGRVPVYIDEALRGVEAR